jgi:hypothetical protein
LRFHTGRSFLLHQQTPTSFLAPSSPRHQQVFWRRCRGIEEEEPPTSTTLSHVNYAPAKHHKFSGAVAGEEEDFCKGSFRTHILYFVLSFSLLYFYLHCFIKNPKKLVSFVVVFTCLLLVLLV